jgi:hypothetical protein
MGTYIATIRTGNKNDQISLEYYKGVLSINSTWEGTKGTLDNMIFTSEWKDGGHQPGDRRPRSIRLGDPATAAKLLTQLAQAAQKEAERLGAGPGSQTGTERSHGAEKGPGGQMPWEGKVKQAEEVFKAPARTSGTPLEDDIPF